MNAQSALEQVEKLLPDKTNWQVAAKLLSGIDSIALGKALDACVDPKSFKDQAMNNAAFIVYYEEGTGFARSRPRSPMHLCPCTYGKCVV